MFSIIKSELTHSIHPKRRAKMAMLMILGLILVILIGIHFPRVVASILGAILLGGGWWWLLFGVLGAIGLCMDYLIFTDPDP